MRNGGVISDPPEIDLGKGYMVPVTWSNMNTTGLPKLPDGYRWKITQPALSLFPLSVKLQYRGCFGIWWTEDYQPAEANVDGIWAAAAFLLRMRNSRCTSDENAKRFVGVYPPKKLEEAK